MYCAILTAVAQRMVAADDVDVADEILEYIGMLPPPMQKDLHRLILLFEYLPPLIIFKRSRFTRLNRADQDQYIEAWGTSRLGLLRTGFRVLKSLCVSTYYQNPESWKAVGYER